MKKTGVAYFKMLEKNEENHNTSLPIAVKTVYNKSANHCTEPFSYKLSHPVKTTFFK